MTKKLPVPLAAIFVLIAAPLLCAEDVVKIYDSSRQSESGQHRTVQISAPLVSFDINSIIAGDSGEGGGDPYTAAVSVNDMPNGPTLAFNVVGSQFTLAQQPYTIELLDQKADKKGFRAKWELPSGNVTLTLVADDNAYPVLYGRLRVERSEPFKILLLLAPGGHAPESEGRDRWVFSEGQDLQHSEDSLPVTTNWLVLYDKLLDPESSQNGKGAAGFLWSELPEADISFHCGSYVSSLTVNVAAGGGDTSFDFILWPFTGIPNESAKLEVKERAAELLKAFSENKDQLFTEGK